MSLQEIQLTANRKRDEKLATNVFGLTIVKPTYSTLVLSVNYLASWVLQHGIEVLVFILGLLMGLLFVIAWRGSATKEISLKNDPRVRALLYGLGGFFTTLIADWKSFLGEGVDKKLLLVLYGIAFGSVALLGPLIMSAVIWIRLSQLKRKKPEECPGQPFYLTLDYFIYGYRYHREEFDREVETARRQKRGLQADAATNLAALILSPDVSIQDVLQNMCSIFKGYVMGSEIPEVNANLMVAISYASAKNEEKNNLKFNFGNEQRYGTLLLVKDYAYEKGEERIALPVEDPNRIGNWIDTVLLGAPEAFLRKKETVVNTNKLDFAKDIPKNVQGEMTQYFTGKGFCSFLCLTVIGGGSVIGIVNIESNHELVSDEIQNEVAKILQPYCAVLSQILLKG